MQELKRSLLMLLFFTVVTGFIFPFSIWVFAQVCLPIQANGSLVNDSAGKIVGSSLIGQSFTEARYFHPRPSSAGSGYDAANSSGTNLGPTSSKLHKGIIDDASTAEIDESYAGLFDLAKKYRQENILGVNELIPADAITRSGSGLDPHISLQNAEFQSRRIAKARNLSLGQINQLISQYTEERFLGIFGERRVNVLLINLALDRLS